MKNDYPIVDLPRPYPPEYGFRLYDYVLEHKPKVVVEFGSSWGFTSIYMAKALQINGSGRLWTCDNDSSRVFKAKSNFEDYGVSELIDIQWIRYTEWLKNPCEFDMCYIDIHNDGKKLQTIFEDKFFESQIRKGKKVLFEGGSSVRNEVAVSRGMSSFNLIKYEYSLIFGDDNTKHVISEINGGQLYE